MSQRLVWRDNWNIYCSFQLFKIDNGYKFVIVRAYRNNGVVDASSAQTIKNARAAGLNQVDAYLYPCISCGDASQQVR